MVEGGDYHQELKRTPGSFQVFALSSAFISVAVGIFATFNYEFSSETRTLGALEPRVIGRATSNAVPAS